MVEFQGYGGCDQRADGETAEMRPEGESSLSDCRRGGCTEEVEPENEEGDCGAQRVAFKKQNQKRTHHAANRAASPKGRSSVRAKREINGAGEETGSEVDERVPRCTQPGFEGEPEEEKKSHIREHVPFVEVVNEDGADGAQRFVNGIRRVVMLDARGESDWAERKPLDDGVCMLRAGTAEQPPDRDVADHEGGSQPGKGLLRVHVRAFREKCRLLRTAFCCREKCG